MRRFCLLLAAAILSLSSPVAAQTSGAPVATASTKDDALRLQLANRFIQLVQGDQMGEAMGQMMGMFLPSSLAGASETEVAEFRAMMVEISGRMAPRLFDAIAPVYAEIFTTEELRALVDFYESDLGRSMMQKSYAAAPRMAEVMRTVMPDVMSDMVVVICERLECSADDLRQAKARLRAQFGG